MIINIVFAVPRLDLLNIFGNVYKLINASRYYINYIIKLRKTLY